MFLLHYEVAQRRRISKHDYSAGGTLKYATSRALFARQLEVSPLEEWVCKFRVSNKIIDKPPIKTLDHKYYLVEEEQTVNKAPTSTKKN